MIDLHSDCVMIVLFDQHGPVTIIEPNRHLDDDERVMDRIRDEFDLLLKGEYQGTLSMRQFNADGEWIGLAEHRIEMVNNELVFVNPYVD